MNQELKEQAHKEFDERFVKKPVDWRENHGWEVPYVNSRADNLKSFIDSIIDKTVQSERERIVDLIERQYGDVVTTNKDVAIPHNCLEYETALDDIITLITNKIDINKDKETL